MEWLTVLGDPAEVKEVAKSRPMFLVVVSSTLTSTIPGISVAGASPELTLYTPALDVEYLVAGLPRSLNVIPVTPEGLPTPAVLTKASLELLGLPVLVVDAGSKVEPKIPHAKLPSRTVGGDIRSGRALPDGASRALFEEARLLGRSLAAGASLVIGESMPGGTTTAMSVMEALGYRARGRVSSSSPRNPHELKSRVVGEALAKCSDRLGKGDVFSINDCLGDPHHISIAGLALGALERGSRVLLAGGTQMCAVVAILRRLGVELRGRLAVATTRWVAEDGQSDIVGLLRDIDPGVTLAYARLDFGDSPFRGLRMYDEGYVKEGVGAGGLLTLLAAAGYAVDEVKRAIYSEYRRVLDLGLSS